MPLLKLWNTLRGRSSDQPPVAPTPSAAVDHARPVTATRPAATHPAAAVTATAPATPATPPKPARTASFSLFGTAQPHAALCKQLPRGEIRSVLEISVEDGSRAIAVLQTLAKRLAAAAVTSANQTDPADPTSQTRAPDAIRYIAIDQFEMAGGTTTLKQFHQIMRAADIRPQVYPEPVDRGLIRVAHTLGAVDLILIAAPTEAWQTPAITALLSRVAHAETHVLYRHGETWQTHVLSEPKLRRAA